eukprot:CAMPEP_0196584712 /NCGR_PEP_ID=MMETSP1081-20130531/48166_1 /TAXON_ID=36882 /ORGANISM="Pyramimonas amylifera, Strain CCMP720" /LENGTH=247 /DNA_ID=CAMNT_0041906023 /DNA_START=335 /DNA_END=1078 /DNA_ORIENTATION=+
MTKIGAAMYQIIYSSGLVWAAIVSRVVLGKVPSLQQGVAILIVTAGLVLNGVKMMAASAPSSGVPASDLLTGSLLTLFITLLFVLMPVLAELANKDLPPQKHLSSAEIGNTTARVGLVVLTVYMLVYTLPAWDSLVTQPLATTGTPLVTVVVWYLGSALLYSLHSHLFLETGRTCGAVGNGLVNAVRSASVVLIGAALFCAPEAQNLCLDQSKMITVSLLVLGGIVYTTAPAATYITAAKKDVKKTQ